MTASRYAWTNQADARYQQLRWCCPRKEAHRAPDKPHNKGYHIFDAEGQAGDTRRTNTLFNRKEKTDEKEIYRWYVELKKRLGKQFLWRFSALEHAVEQIKLVRAPYQATAYSLILAQRFIEEFLLLGDLDNKVDRHIINLMNATAWMVQNPNGYVENKIKAEGKKLSAKASAIHAEARAISDKDSALAAETARGLLKCWTLHLQKRSPKVEIISLDEHGPKPDDVDDITLEERAIYWYDEGFLLPAHTVFKKHLGDMRLDWLAYVQKFIT